MAIIITGGTGFIGSFLARELVATIEEEIILFDYFINHRRITDIKDSVSVFQGDVSNFSEIISIVNKYQEDISAIYHLGSLMPPLTEQKPEVAFKTNIGGTLNVLEAARMFSGSKIPKVIYSSSGAVYGPGVDLPITEKTFRDPWTMYGAGKACSEILGSYYNRRKGVNFLTIRFPALIGPGRTGRGLTVYSNNIVQYPAQGHKAVCNVEPDVTIPILYIKDASILLASLLNVESYSEQAYNLDGFWISAEELASMVKDELPEAEIEYEPELELSFQLKSWSLLKGDDSLIRKDLNFSPSFPPEIFVKDFIREVQEKSFYQI
ncbi:MAG: NAD-dependent epimerase/dehydratase family protein [Candidatus Hodarchaeales archaeon]|jgi:nucleoside-diphosphate-sugar epimerase